MKREGRPMRRGSCEEGCRTENGTELRGRLAIRDGAAGGRVGTSKGRPCDWTVLLETELSKGGIVIFGTGDRLARQLCRRIELTHQLCGKDTSMSVMDAAALKEREGREHAGWT